MSSVIGDLHTEPQFDILQDSMESFNKILALFIGLLVILLAAGYAIGKTRNKPTAADPKKESVFSNLFKPKATPTPTVASVMVGNNDNIQVIEKTVTNEDGSVTVSGGVPKGGTPDTIPATGAGAALPLIISSLTGGIYLLKKSRG